MATLYRRKRDGYWYMSYYLNGKRFKVSTGTQNKKLAQAKYDDLKVKLFRGEMGIKPSQGNRPTIANFFRRYKEHRLNSSPFDIHSEVSKLNIWQEFFARKGVRYLLEINPALVDEFLTVALADRKPSTKQNYFNLLKRILNKAIEWEIIEFNPIAKKKPPQVPKSFIFFNEDEVVRLINAAEEPTKTGIRLLVHTGMRSEELQNLRCRDVDLKANNIRVWPYEGFTPKGKRPRTIPIVNAIKPDLKQLLKGKKLDDYVFKPFHHPLRLTKRFSELVKRLKLKGSLHDLRHTFATHLARSGVPIIEIKELLGHSSIATTNIYAHFVPNPEQSKVKKLKFG